MYDMICMSWKKERILSRMAFSLNHEVLFIPRTKGGVKEKVNNGVGEMTLILFYTSRGRLWTVSSEQ